MSNEDLNNRIMHELGEIKGEIKGTNKRLDSINGSIEQHAKRIRDTETGLAVIKSKAAMIGGIAGVVIVAGWEWMKSQFKGG